MANLSNLLNSVAKVPLGIERALHGFDVSGEFDRLRNVADNDRRRVEGFMPAIIEKLTELVLVSGYSLGVDNQGSVGLDLEAHSDKAGLFIAETIGLVKMWEHRMDSIMGGNVIGDPTKVEREMTRIWAKRNELNADYQHILGVSDGTPTAYPEEWADKWL